MTTCPAAAVIYLTAMIINHAAMSISRTAATIYHTAATISLAAIIISRTAIHIHHTAASISRTAAIIHCTALIVYHVAVFDDHTAAIICLTAITNYLGPAYIYSSATNIFQKIVDKTEELYYIVTDGRYRPTVGIDCGSVKED